MKDLIITKEELLEEIAKIESKELYPSEVNKTKIITLCGSSKYCDLMAVCAWFLERNEHVITMGLHLLPSWYCTVPDHLAEHENCADEMDELHKRKIDISDEIFVVNFQDYIGSSTRGEIKYAEKLNKPIRYYNTDIIGEKVDKLIKNIKEKN